MIERLHRRRSGDRPVRSGVPLVDGAGSGPGSTLPVALPPDVPVSGEPTLLGFPVDVEPDGPLHHLDGDRPGGEVASGSQAAARIVVRRRADLVAGTALALAGVAANISLWLPWVAGEGTGLALVRHAIDVARSGAPELLRPGSWEPVTVVLCGGLLALLGLLVLVPARTHRLLGVLALLLALTAAAAVTSLLAGAHWSTARFGTGLWSGAAVAGLGLVGAFKAMLTLPLVTTVGQERSPGR